MCDVTIIQGENLSDSGDIAVKDVHPIRHFEDCDLFGAKKP